MGEDVMQVKVFGKMRDVPKPPPEFLKFMESVNLGVGVIVFTSRALGLDVEFELKEGDMRRGLMGADFQKECLHVVWRLYENKFGGCKTIRRDITFEELLTCADEKMEEVIEEFGFLEGGMPC